MTMTYEQTLVRTGNRHFWTQAALVGRGQESSDGKRGTVVTIYRERSGGWIVTAVRWTLHADEKTLYRAVRAETPHQVIAALRSLTRWAANLARSRDDFPLNIAPIEAWQEAENTDPELSEKGPNV
jgi:hypothetical protein